MATIKESVGLSKTYGARYGRKIREEVAALEMSARAKYVCPYCKYQQVKRLSAGIWQCKKCAAKFTGKAYSADRKFSSPYAIEVEQIESAKEEA